MVDDHKLAEIKKINLQLARNEYNWQKEKEKLLLLYQQLLT
jgi:hypothetical protein